MTIEEFAALGKVLQSARGTDSEEIVNAKTKMREAMEEISEEQHMYMCIDLLECLRARDEERHAAILMAVAAHELLYKL